MTDTIHIMLDLETWGTEPGCDIRSIGACVFDPVTGTVQTAPFGPVEGAGAVTACETPGLFYVACDNPVIDRMRRMNETGTEFIGFDDVHQWPLKRDQRTVEWWNDPERAEAAKAFGDPVPLDQACKLFTGWLCQVTGYDREEDTGPPANVRLWSHGAHFDGPILAAVYAACGMPVPWHYRSPRDTRTAFDMAGIDDHTAHITKFASGTYHHALDDAITQAKAVCEAFTIVRDWKTDADDLQLER